MKSYTLIILCGLLFSVSFTSVSQPGSLDLSFGDNGIVIGPVFPTPEQVYGMAIQADDKIVVAGLQKLSTTQNFLAARYNSNGSLDQAFGNNGIVSIDAGTNSDAAWDIVIQDDGKILLAGSVYEQFSTVDDYAMLRLNSDGSPDNTFGTNGIITTDIDEQWDNAYAIVVLDDGKILLAGDAYTTIRNVCIVKYMPDGSLDQTFGASGIAVNPVCCGESRARDMCVQSDGKIIVAGYMNEGIDDQAFVARFLPDGSFDASFGNNGVSSLDVGGLEDRFIRVSVLPDGKIIAAGQNGSNSSKSNWDYMLVKYNADGTLDNSFGSNGIFLANYNPNDFVLDMIIQDDGKILIAGGGFMFQTVRFTANGDLDMDFGENGFVNTDVGGVAFGTSIGLQSNGSIVVAGHSDNPDAYDITLCRYHAEEGGNVSEANIFPGVINIYPNPARDKFILNYQLYSEQSMSADLINPNGKLIQSLMKTKHHIAGTYSKQLYISHGIKGGIYFLRVYSNKGSITQKLLIQ